MVLIRGSLCTAHSSPLPCVFWTSHPHRRIVCFSLPRMGEVRLHKVILRGKPSQLNEGSQPCKIHASGLVTLWPNPKRATYSYHHLMQGLNVKNKD